MIARLEIWQRVVILTLLGGLAAALAYLNFAPAMPQPVAKRALGKPIRVATSGHSTAGRLN